MQAVLGVSEGGRAECGSVVVRWCGGVVVKVEERNGPKWDMGRNGDARKEERWGNVAVAGRRRSSVGFTLRAASQPLSRRAGWQRLAADTDGRDALVFARFRDPSRPHAHLHEPQNSHLHCTRDIHIASKVSDNRHGCL